MRGPQPGELLAGRYLLGGLLGQGGVADVFRATDQQLGREVAVKVLRPGAGDATASARLAAEARTVAGLSHPHVVTLLDAGLEGSQPWIVMELVDGPSLRDALATGRVSAQRLAAMLAGTADGLAHAHARGVVHRDVKPANILLERDDRARLADFGIATLAEGSAGLTLPGQAIGSPAYLAPEQVTGGPVTPAADVYALGLVALEGLTGRRAFEGTTLEVAYARTTSSPEIPASLGPGWVGLLARMTAREPDQRPSAAEVATELRRITQRVSPVEETAVMTAAVPLLAEPPPAPPAPPASPASPASPPAPEDVRRRLPRWLLPAGLAAAALLVLVLALTGTGETEDRDEVPPVPEGVPTQLEQPLEELHEAVHGSPS